jgi:hypothetical protein
MCFAEKGKMQKTIFQSKSAIAKLLVIVLVAVVVGGAAGAAYYAATSMSGSPSPTQTPGQTQGPTASPSQSAVPTATPSQTTGAYRVGAYAEYLLNSTAASYTIKLSVDREETYSGTECWVYVMTSETDSLGFVQKVITTRWLSKATLECLHIRLQGYVSGNLVSDEEFAGDSEEGSEMPNLVKPVVGTETITVAAGTFENCVKGDGGGSIGGTTMVSRSWSHADVPFDGLVKLESYSGDNLLSLYELTAYGG